jgi:hypothetical protein
VHGPCWQSLPVMILQFLFQTSYTYRIYGQHQLNPEARLWATGEASGEPWKARAKKNALGGPPLGRYGELWRPHVRLCSELLCNSRTRMVRFADFFPLSIRILLLLPLFLYISLQAYTVFLHIWGISKAFFFKKKFPTWSRTPLVTCVPKDVRAQSLQIIRYFQTTTSSNPFLVPW